MPCYFTKGNWAQSPPIRALTTHRDALKSHTVTPPREHISTVDVARAALVHLAAVCERPHSASASASDPHERRSVATTQNTLPRSCLRLHVAARNSSQRCPPHQLTVRPLAACVPAQRACAPQPAVAGNATQPTNPSHDARKLIAYALLGPQLAVDPLLLLFPIGARSPYPLLQLLPLRHEEALVQPYVTHSAFYQRTCRCSTTRSLGPACPRPPQVSHA